MLAKIFNFLSKRKTVNDVFSPSVLMPRKLCVSNILFSFSMPENFSIDMPADDMIENIDLYNNKTLNSAGVINVLNRWWDYNVVIDGKTIKASTRFSIDIIKDIKIDPKAIFDMEKLIKLEHEELESFYTPINEQHLAQGKLESEVLLPLYPEHYRNITLNDTSWLNYTLSGSKTADFYLHPLAQNHYIKIGFHFSPHTHFLNCNELREIMGAEVERISNTFYFNKDTNAKIE